MTTPAPRRLVKVYLRRDVADALIAYAGREHRSVSSAAEHVLAEQLLSPADPAPLHLRDAPPTLPLFDVAPTR